jgi:hypothetical protein
MFDGGEWKYHQNKTPTSPTHNYFVEGGNSSDDVRLYINGNLTADLARKYGEELAAFLNRPEPTYFEIKLAQVRSYENLPPSQELVAQLTRISTAAAIDANMGHDEAIVIINKANAQIRRMKESI